jgi:hypothetical protein
MAPVTVNYNPVRDACSDATHITRTNSTTTQWWAYLSDAGGLHHGPEGVRGEAPVQLRAYRDVTAGV